MVTSGTVHDPDRLGLRQGGPILDLDDPIDLGPPAFSGLLDLGTVGGVDLMVTEESVSS